MFDVDTDDPAALRRSIRIGWVGIAGSLVLLLWNAATLYLGDGWVVSGVFAVVGVVLLTAFGIRTARARSRLNEQPRSP